ncbi:hypothetical protein DFH09DRAFT_1357389 [Mycena vulgaris]|nr:hypothetical protein DFH09DRAFT_1357389 [Mycena vulgaris]
MSTALLRPSTPPPMLAVLHAALRLAPTTAKYLLLLLLALNAGSWLLVWHLRVFSSVIEARLAIRLVKLRHVFSGREKRAAALERLYESRMLIGVHPFRKMLMCGWKHRRQRLQLHMSNSSFAKALDVARFRLALETFPSLLRCGGWIPLAATHYHFIREIPILSRYEVRASIGAWDDKWIWVVSRFAKPPSQNSKSSSSTNLHRLPNPLHPKPPRPRSPKRPRRRGAPRTRTRRPRSSPPSRPPRRHSSAAPPRLSRRITIKITPSARVEVRMEPGRTIGMKPSRARRATRGRWKRRCCIVRFPLSLLFLECASRSSGVISFLFSTLFCILPPSFRVSTILIALAAVLRMRWSRFLRVRRWVVRGICGGAVATGSGAWSRFDSYTCVSSACASSGARASGAFCFFSLREAMWMWFASLAVSLCSHSVVWCVCSCARSGGRARGTVHVLPGGWDADRAAAHAYR